MTAFAFAQLTTAFAFGRASDVYGRKPTILVSLVGVCIALIGFGLSTTFIEVLIWRCLMGALNGSSIISRTAIAELTDLSNEARAFSLLPVAWSVGGLLGSMIGGLLARPVEQYPALFGGDFLRRYPYALSCGVAALVPLIGAVVTALFFREVRSATKST